jgi:DNA-binding GntR family transcriptional regulator
MCSKCGYEYEAKINDRQLHNTPAVEDTNPGESSPLDLTKIEQRDARMLGIEADLSVMLFECTSYDDNDRVIEFCRTYTRGDKVNFNVHFQKE